MKRNNTILRLICIMCATLLLCGMFAACGNTGVNPQNPTDAPTEAPTNDPTEDPTNAPGEDPTENPTEEPTEEPTEGPTEEPVDKDSSIMDGDDHIQIPFD